MKRSVDDGNGSGRFLSTGSVRAELLQASWAATGRIIRLTQWGLSQRELVGNVGAPSFFDRVFANETSSFGPAPGEHTLRTYVEIALHGGFPELAHQVSGDRRKRSAEYVKQINALHWLAPGSFACRISRVQFGAITA